MTATLLDLPLFMLYSENKLAKHSRGQLSYLEGTFTGRLNDLNDLTDEIQLHRSHPCLQTPKMYMGTLTFKFYTKILLNQTKFQWTNE